MINTPMTLLDTQKFDKHLWGIWDKTFYVLGYNPYGASVVEELPAYIGNKKNPATKKILKAYNLTPWVKNTRILTYPPIEALFHTMLSESISEIISKTE